MATSILLNTVSTFGNLRWPGEAVDDSKEDASSLRVAGGVLWPSNDPLVAAAAGAGGNGGGGGGGGGGIVLQLSRIRSGAGQIVVTGGKGGAALGGSGVAGTAGSIGHVNPYVS